MLKKALALTTVLLLLAPVALAMGPQGGRPNPVIPGMGQGLGRGSGPLERAENALNRAKARLERLQTQLREDPAALRAQMLARHDEVVKRAEALLADKANLPAKLVSDFMAAQARALEVAKRRAKEALNPEVAARRLAIFKEQQARNLAKMRENAAQIAARKIEQAEKTLGTAAAVRASIESGEKIDQMITNLEEQIERLEAKIARLRARRNRGA